MKTLQIIYRVCRQTIAIIILVLFSSILHAQSLQPTVIGTLGGYNAPSGGASLSFNMGETFVSTLQSGSYMLTQGFEQPINIFSIIGDSIVCATSTTTLSDSTPGGTWSSSNTTIATVGSTGVVTGLATGSDTIRYGISGTVVTKIITVNPLPSTATVSGATSVCVAANITLTDATISGSWSATNTKATVMGGVVTGVSAGIDTIRYTITNTCGAATESKIVTINPLPMAGTITGASTVCATANITLTDAITGGAWSSSNITLATVAGGVVLGVSAGIDTIKYTVTNTCGTAMASKSVTINPLPIAGTIAGDSTVCASATITLTDPATGGAWGHSNSAATVATGVVTGVHAGIDTIGYAVTNVCGTATAVKAITVNPLPIAGSISGTTSVCVDSAITLTDTVTGGVWNASNSLAAISGGVVTGASAGMDTFSYAVTNICGVATAIKIMTINPLPVAGAITGDSAVCSGAAILLTDPASGGVWSSGSGAAMVSGGIVFGISAGTAAISYIVTNMCGTATAVQSVTISDPLSPGAITGPSSVCPDSAITLTDTVTGGVWSSVNSLAMVGSTGIVTGITTGVDIIVYSVTNVCGIEQAIYPVDVLADGSCSPASVNNIAKNPTTLQVYPNPNDGVFTIVLSSGSNENVQVVITNMVGEKIKEITTVTNKLIDIKLNTASGIYFLSAITVHGNYIAKVTIE